jgi:general secretion pathway protein N
VRWTGAAFRVAAFAAAGSAAFAAALIVLAPATLVDAGLERASEGRLRLAGAEGSLWSGAGWIEIRDARGTSGVAKRIAWRVLPASVLRGRLAAEVQLGEAAAPFPLTLSFSRIEIAHAGVRLPAAALGLGVPRLAPFGLTGDLQVEIPHLAFERGRMEGDATLRWRAAGSALTPIAPLGDYEVQLKAAGSGLHAILSTLEGPLQLEGKGTWSNGAAPSFLAVARVPAQYEEQLSPLLRLIAIERGAGSFEISSSTPAFGH